MQLEGSCYCGAVKFSVAAYAPVPFLRCYCSICRKSAGGGGYAINLGAKAATMKVTGEKNIGVFHAVIDGKESEGRRHFCKKCGTALWVFDPRWPDLIHPFASAIDSDLPVPPTPDAYAEVVKRVTKGLDCTLMFEPGRMIVGNAGILVSRVIYVKHGEARNFVIIDAAMNDLIRPTLYEAHHEILPVREISSQGESIVADVVGPVCETGDYLALGRRLPALKAGDLVAVMSSGAYGAVQAGTYNTRGLVPEVLVKGDQYAVVRPRIDPAELIALDRIAPWLT